MTIHLLLHFLRFDIQTHSLDLKPWVDRLYASNDLTHRFPDHAARLRLLIERQDSAHALPIEPLRGGVFAETRLGLGPCFYADGRFYSAHTGAFSSAIDYAPRSHTIRANIGEDYARSTEAVIAKIIRPLLQGFVLPFYQLKTIHGAGVSAGDRTFLLIGGSGSGKSTTAIQLMQSGYDLLADDGPLFTLDDGGVYALSSLDYLHVTDGTLSLFPALQPHVVGGKDEWGKWAVSLNGLSRGSSRALPRRVTDIVQLRRAPVAAPRLVPLERRSVMRDLLRESMVVFRARPFRDDPLFRRYSELILALVTTLTERAHIYAMEFADHHLRELPALLRTVPGSVA